MHSRKTPPPMMLPRKRLDKRRQGRLVCELLKCELGTVVDLSATGMRVQRRSLTKAKKGEERVFTLEFGSGRAIQVRGRIARVRKLGLFKYEIGVEFVDVTAGIKESLCVMARVCVTSMGA